MGDGVPDGICLDTEGAVWYADVPHQRCVRVRGGRKSLAFAWSTRILRLVRDDERLPIILAGLHLVVLACLMLHHWMAFSSP